MTDKGGSADWLAINAYGALVAFLAVLSGVGYFADLAGNSNGFGRVPVYLWAAHLGYIGAGAVMLYGFFRAKVAPEVFGSVVLVAANLFTFAHATIGLGRGDQIRWRDVAVSVVLTVVVVARGRALLRGGVYTLPTWTWRRPRRWAR